MDVPPLVRLVFGGLKATTTRWISAHAAGRAPSLNVHSSFVRVYVLLRMHDGAFLKIEYGSPRLTSIPAMRHAFSEGV